VAQPIITNDAFDAAVATQVAASGGPLNGAKLHLIQTPVPAPLNRSTVLATLITAEATYTGYGAKSITWSTPTYNEAGQIEMLGTTAAFAPTGTSVTNNIGGWFLTDTAGAVLECCGLFDGAPIPMASALNQLTPVIRYNPLTGGVSINYF
jgi:hypothetical protein